MKIVPLLAPMILAAALASAGVSPAHASPEGIRAAIAAMDAAAMQREAATDAEKQLVAAVTAAWTVHDAATAEALSAAADAQGDLALKAAALRELAALLMRRGEFAAAASAGLRARVIEEPDAGELQAMAFVQALVSVGPTRALDDAAGRTPIKRDLAGLMRSDISVGDQSVGAILDTGANFSTMNETSARRLGLRMLDTAVSVGSSSRDAVASRLGVADRLSIGGAEFSNVVFIVLPDADLSFANGAYTIDAILGMPVFLEMGRIAFTREGDGEVFVFGPADAPADAGQIVRMRGLAPMLEAQAVVAGESQPIVFMLDTGAQRTSFYGRFASDFAPLMEGATQVQAQAGGAGGMVTRDVRRIPSVQLNIGGKAVTLTNSDVNSDAREDRHGLLGLDALGRDFWIDFKAGRLVVN